MPRPFPAPLLETPRVFGGASLAIVATHTLAGTSGESRDTFPSSRPCHEKLIRRINSEVSCSDVFQLRLELLIDAVSLWSLLWFPVDVWGRERVRRAVEPNSVSFRRRLVSRGLQNVFVAMVLSVETEGPGAAPWRC